MSNEQTPVAQQPLDNTGLETAIPYPQPPYPQPPYPQPPYPQPVYHDDAPTGPINVPATGIPTARNLFAWMTGGLVALAMLVGVIGYAVTHWNHPQVKAEKAQNQAFLNQLDKVGLNISNQDSALRDGRAVCAIIASGEPVVAAADYVKGANADLDYTGAVFVAVTAVQTLCPDDSPFWKNRGPR